MRIHDKLPVAEMILSTASIGVVLAILIGIAVNWQDSDWFDRQMDSRLQKMADACALAEVEAHAVDNFDYINKTGQKLGVESPLYQQLNESVWNWWIYFQNTLRYDLFNTNYYALQSFYLTQKITSQQFRSALDNPSAGAEAVVGLLDEFEKANLSDTNIKHSLTVRQKLRNIISNHPSYNQLYPHALPINCLNASLLAFPIALLISILIFVFRIHEDILIPDPIAKVARRFRPCSCKK